VTQYKIRRKYMIKRIKELITAAGISVGVFGLAIAPVGAAPQNYTLFGEASLVSPGNNSDTAAQLVSDADPGFSGVSFEVPAGTTFADLQTLSTDFNVTDDDCAAGSPRFQIEVTTADGPKNIFVYLGPAPGYTLCTPNTWLSSGDLLEAGLTVDTSQLAGGTFYDQYADALTEFGNLPVTGISLVIDSGFAFPDGEQTVLIDNIQIDDEDAVTFEQEVVPPVTPTTKEECKKGGWQSFNGMFKNQGDCVSYVASGGRAQSSNQ
jgi:hypothetical protein